MAKRKIWRAALLWFLGSMCILFGAIMAGNSERTLGSAGVGYMLGITVAFVLVLVGGLMWIAVSIAVKKE